MKFGGSGTADGQFLSPAGVAVDAADNIIVTDDQRAIVQQFAKDGTFLTNLGSSGTGTGQFVTPLDVAIDQLGTVYITEGTNDRIEVYGLPFITATSTSGKGSGVIVSSDGLIRCGTDCSQRYDASKKVSLEALASTGSYFNAWGGTYCSGSSSTCSFTPLAATAETASFSLFPQLSLTDKPPRKSKSKDATFRFRMGCEGATFQCKLDSKSFSACTSPKSYSKLKKGSHTFTVRALKNGGKSEAKTFSWRIKKK